MCRISVVLKLLPAVAQLAVRPLSRADAFLRLGEDPSWMGASAEDTVDAGGFGMAILSLLKAARR
jgi:hypothetical protein